MSAIKKKVVMLGTSAVGKTSLVRRFVKSIFSEKYQTTVGVKIDKKQLILEDNEITLILWDLHGEDEFQKIQTSYLRGGSGFFLVVDGTRRETLDTAILLRETALQHMGNVPYSLLVNKSDLRPNWGIQLKDTDRFRRSGGTVLETSAKSGDGVEAAFADLARRMMS